MSEKEQPVFVKCFGRIEDPRLDRQKKHKLIDLIAMAVCATIAGADAWIGIALYAKSKEAWLRTFLELPNGIPSHDTFGRVFGLLDLQAFQEAFREWVGIIIERYLDHLATAQSRKPLEQTLGSFCAPVKREGKCHRAIKLHRFRHTQDPRPRPTSHRRLAQP